MPCTVYDIQRYSVYLQVYRYILYGVNIDTKYTYETYTIKPNNSTNAHEHSAWNENLLVDHLSLSDIQRKNVVESTDKNFTLYNNTRHTNILLVTNIPRLEWDANNIVFDAKRYFVRYIHHWMSASRGMRQLHFSLSTVKYRLDIKNIVVSFQ